MDLTKAESKATYDEIKEYVLEHSGLKVSNLYIAQVKRKCGIVERVNYNLPKSENGTETGKKAIETFFQEQGIKGAAVTYEKEIVNHASQIINETKCIWPKTGDNVFTVVREFNMTKGNVFPNEMLSNAKKAICMFVKKREII